MSITPLTPEQLKSARRSMGMSQAELAAAIGASTRSIEEWEAGRRPTPAMLSLALAAVNKQIEPLVPGEDPLALYAPLSGFTQRKAWWTDTAENLLHFCDALRPIVGTSWFKASKVGEYLFREADDCDLYADDIARLVTVARGVEAYQTVLDIL